MTVYKEEEHAPVFTTNQEENYTEVSVSVAKFNQSSTYERESGNILSSKPIKTRKETKKISNNFLKKRTCNEVHDEDNIVNNLFESPPEKRIKKDENTRGSKKEGKAFSLKHSKDTVSILDKQAHVTDKSKPKFGKIKEHEDCHCNQNIQEICKGHDGAGSFYSKPIVVYSDIKCLSEKGWINDAVLNLYFYTKFGRANNKYKVHSPSDATFFYRAFCENEERREKLVNRLPDALTTFNAFILPIHNVNHWTLAVVNFEKECFEYYDSKLTSTGKQFAFQVFEDLKTLMQLHARRINSKMNCEEWKQECYGDLLIQENNNDCGICVIHFTELLFPGPIMENYLTSTACMRTIVKCYILQKQKK
ncbi:hypothetical protein AKO1_001059 [Acrasis kona]|uniref:Ubiquitin-like protease family profile domain-containing protein n=1 Tax=Acrasis kona TaxID=1008807 RepID=A0AAW2ZU01_9EUKA